MEALRKKIAEAAWSADQRAARAQEETAAIRRTSAVHIRWLHITVCYGILVTVFTAVYSTGFIQACRELGSMITDNFIPAIYLMLQVLYRIAHMTDNIPHEAWRSACYWAVLLSICGAALFALRLCIRWLLQFSTFYRRYLADWISSSVLLISMAAAVFFAAQINVMVNAIIMMLLVNLVYTVVRSIRIYLT